MASVDLRILHWLYGGPAAAGLWLWAMVGLTLMGSGWSLLAIAPFAWPAKTRGVALRLLGALVATAVVVFAVKALVGRARPCACLGDVHALVFAAPHDPSFPSGHAAGAFAFAAFVALEILQRNETRLRRLSSPRPFGLSSRLRRILRWLAVAALFAIAVGIALSRVVLGVHFPSDITAGAVIGTVVGAVVWRTTNLRNAPAGVGISGEWREVRRKSSSGAG